MAYGDRIDSQIKKDDPSASSIVRTTDTDFEDDGCIDNLPTSISSGKRKFAADEQPGKHRIKSVVARRAQYVRDVYSDWADNMEATAIGVSLMSITREANVQGKVHFRYRALGGSYIRPQRGRTILYGGGEFRLFNGVAPVYMISRCREYAECVEGRIWCIGARRHIAIGSSHICSYG